MDGDAQAGAPALVDDVAVVREAKALDHRPGDVDPDHAPRSPADGLRGEDLVQLAAERTVEAEDEPGLDLRVFEDRAVHARTAAAMMWSRSCSSAAVALHRVEAQLEAGDIAAPIPRR